MVDEELKSRLQELQKLLAESKVSAEDRNLLGNLMKDIVEMTGGEQRVEKERQGGLRDKLERYAGEFEQRHPTAAGVMRQIADSLGKMGI